MLARGLCTSRAVVGPALGMTVESVRHHEKNALAKIRRALERTVTSVQPNRREVRAAMESIELLLEYIALVRKGDAEKAGALEALIRPIALVVDDARRGLPREL